MSTTVACASSRSVVGASGPVWAAAVSTGLRCCPLRHPLILRPPWLLVLLPTNTRLNKQKLAKHVRFTDNNGTPVACLGDGDTGGPSLHPPSEPGAQVTNPWNYRQQYAPNPIIAHDSAVSAFVYRVIWKQKRIAPSGDEKSAQVPIELTWMWSKSLQCGRRCLFFTTKESTAQLAGIGT
ncbi:hypothetical protein GUJ93_ZPchr0012g19944 [Zizania palustris]|uniref:Uncharacterized protein n=1 Tax=Zizania palustris TaxID=103762 RepID=A0A8J6BSH4_ZIZPA|nr:hypothetical protein GUJ93_ZPchr0012g19944 [Zizania palustris]